MDPSQNPNIVHATTIISVRRGGHVAVAGDGQVTLGHTVMKGNARKVRRLGREGQVLAGFAGAAADAFTLFELFEAKLDKHGQLTRAAVELAKDWRTERRLGKLEALLAVADRDLADHQRYRRCDRTGRRHHRHRVRWLVRPVGCARAAGAHATGCQDHRHRSDQYRRRYLHLYQSQRGGRAAVIRELGLGIRKSAPFPVPGHASTVPTPLSRIPNPQCQIPIPPP